MTPDTLEVELQILDAKADAVLANFKRKLEGTTQNINDVGKNSDFAREFNTQFVDIERKALQTQKTLQAIGRPVTGGGLDWISKSAVEAQKEASKLQTRIREIEKAASQTSNKNLLKIYAEDAKTAERELEQLERKIMRLEQARVNRPPQGQAARSISAAGNLNNGLNALGLPEIGAAVAVGAAVSFGKEAVTAAREAANSQRLLQATAKETGIAYSKLTNEARLFGEQTLQSNAKAQESFAQIVNFANAAGRSDKLVEFRQRFADLAAAKGIDPSKMGEIAKQLNALTDEATDKLLNGNPSAFYDKFAKSIGTTADKLTDAQKRAAVFDEVLRKGVIFSGEAEKRINDSASALDRLNARFENFKVTAGKALLPLIEFAEVSTNLADRVLKGTGTQNDFVKGVNSSVLTIPVRPVINAVDAGSQAIADLITGRKTIEREVIIRTKLAEIDKENSRIVEFLRKSDADIRAAQANPFGSFDNLALSKINLSTGFFNEAERKKAIEAARADAQKFVDDLRKKFENPQLAGNVGLLKMAQRDFRQYANLFDSETRFKIQQSLASAISDGTAKGFQLAFNNPDASLAELRQNLKQIFAAQDLLPDAKNVLVNQFESKIKQSVEAAKAKVLELEKTYTSVLDNLFARQSANNPFVSLFTEADKSLKTLRENTRGLQKDVVTSFELMLAKQNQFALSSGRLDNRLDAFDLREQAANFRNPFDPEKLKTEEEEFIKRFLYNNPNYLYLKNKKEVDADTRKDILSFGLFDTPQSRLNKSLDEKFDLIYGRGKLSPEQQALADRKFLSVTQGVSPLELSNGNREQAALVREREAARRERYEQDAMALYREQRDLQRKIEANTARQNKIAETQGEQGIKVDITTKDESPTTKTTAKRPTAADTEQSFSFDGFGIGGGTNR